MVGNPRYVPTTTDDEFFSLLQSEKWSVVFFAPGACRFSAAAVPIPGGNEQSRGWTLEEYTELVRELQGEQIQIVEALDESETVGLLSQALAEA